MSAELSPGTGISVEVAPGWKPGSEPGRFVADFGSLAGSTTIERSFRLVSSSADCAEARPVIVVTTTEGGIVRRQPLVGDGVLLNSCGGGERDLAAMQLPQGGFGGSEAGGGLL